MPRAAACVDGRALTLCEGVHVVTGVSRSRAERVFISSAWRKRCRRIAADHRDRRRLSWSVVSLGRALGWDDVGRLCNCLRVGLPGNNEWCLVKALRVQVKTKLVSMGVAAYAKD